MPFFIDFYSVIFILQYFYANIGQILFGGKIHYQLPHTLKEKNLILLNFNDLAMGFYQMFHLMIKSWDHSIDYYEKIFPEYV